MGKDLTPAQKQYMELKSQYKDCILFFRMGDFYETFYEDAKICSRKLHIALTSKNKNADEPVPMAGVPCKSAEKYISKLIKAGYKVAKAEQVGEVVPGKLVKRDVVEVITPGTYLEEDDNQKYNYIAGVCFTDKYQLAWGDFSLGEYWTRSFDELEDMLKFLVMLSPSEIVVDIDFPQRSDLEEYIQNFDDSFISVYDQPDDVQHFLKNKLSVGALGGFGQAFKDGRDRAIGLLLDYIKNTQKSDIKNIVSISFWGEKNKVHLDDVTLKNLEIFESSYEGSEKHSLYGVLDSTNTAMGARLLQDFLQSPISNTQQLDRRLDNIDYYCQNEDLRDDIIEVLKSLIDIQRIITRILHKRNSPFLWDKLKTNLKGVFNFDKDIQDIQIDDLIERISDADKMGELDNIGEKILFELKRLDFAKTELKKVLTFYKKIDDTIKDKDEDFSDKSGYIQKGVDEDIDKYRKIAYKSDDILIEYQETVSEKIDVPVKLKYTKTGGYFLEIRKTHSDTVEDFLNNHSDKFEQEGDFQDKFQLVRRKTLKYAERYVTNHLKELEEKIMTAKENLESLEKQVLDDLQSQLQEYNKSFFELADKLAYLDIFTFHSKFAQDHNWIKPSINKGYDMEIQKGRHPVIEKFLPQDEEFIPNNLDIQGNFDQNDNLKNGRVNIITGPNMGGKSTYLRQNAIIVLLAHCGLYVPAQKANISLVDGIFARVGAGDVIAKNQSTFMTEMIEMGNILHNATSKSFVILDELGRGTSTYDGMALAKAVIIYIARELKAKTLFATHYHELIELQDQIKGIENYSVGVYETKEEVVFMKKISKGGASKSYGIEVAKLAGIPKSIVKKAEQYLKQMENKGSKKTLVKQPLFDKKNLQNTDKYKKKYEKIEEKLDNIDIDNITPLKAMNQLNELKKQISENN